MVACRAPPEAPGHCRVCQTPWYRWLGLLSSMRRDAETVATIARSALRVVVSASGFTPRSRAVFETAWKSTSPLVPACQVPVPSPTPRR